MSSDMIDWQVKDEIKPSYAKILAFHKWLKELTPANRFVIDETAAKQLRGKNHANSCGLCKSGGQGYSP